MTAAPETQEASSPRVARAPNDDVTLIFGFTRHPLSPEQARKTAAAMLELAGAMPDGPTNPKTQLADLDRLLELTVTARQAENSALYKTDSDRACRKHGEACDALWNELDRQVACRRGAGHPVRPFDIKPDDAARALRRVKRDVLAQLVERLPHAIKGILEEIEEETRED